MALQNVQNHEEMLGALLPDKKNYVLLYKAGSNTSECSFKNLIQAADKLQDANVLLADVSAVRDIHQQYQVQSVPALLVFDGKKYINVVKGCNEPAYYISLFEDSLYQVSTVNSETTQKRVTVYSTPSCSWCNTLKSYLKSHNIRFVEVDVSKNQSAAEQMVSRSGQQGVPQTDINGEIIVGFDKPKINRLLGIQSIN